MRTAPTGGRVGEGRLAPCIFDTALEELNDRLAETCEAMKAEGLVIHAVTFAVANNSGGNRIRETFRDCTSNTG